MINRFDLPISQTPFNSVKTPINKYQLTKEVLFFLLYTLALILLISNSINKNLSDGVMYFGSLKVNAYDLFTIFIISLSSMLFLSFIFKYIIIKFNLNPNIMYGHLFSKKTLDIFNKELVYLEYSLSYKDDFYVDIKLDKLYAQNIFFLTNNSQINFNAQFRNIKHYKCQREEIVLTYKDLLDKYDTYNLNKIMPKKHFIDFAIKKDFSNNQEFLITLNYINNNQDSTYDLVVYNEKFIDNYTLKYGNFLVSSILFIIACYFFYDLVFSNTIQNLWILVSKTIQYNILIYFLLFLFYKKFLFR